MSLPMDISTALWWRSVPVWDWEALPPAPAAGDAAAPAADTVPCEPPAPAATAAAWASPAPAAQPGTEREGYRLVFKGYEVCASVFWYPADSALSRPWLRHDEPTADRRPGTEADDAAARAEALRRSAAAGDAAQPRGAAAGADEAGPT